MDLGRFGFTPTEGRVYAALLRVGPATGYAVARAARLARANAYGAMESLAGRGFAARLPGRPARYVAAEPETVVARLDAEWKRDLARLTDSLAALQHGGAAGAGWAVELLSDRHALMDSFASCTRGATDELLAVVGPWAADLYGDLEAGGRSRITSRILSLGTPAPARAQVREVPADEILAYWGGLPLAVVADRRRAVLGLASGEVANGIATAHPAVVPFVRHLLRRELATTSHPAP
jgi:sugar-specific transcriptional regulator TrmB